tara:strand:- start:39 stop:1091 length:1053 start_codon:yes stop_codon:yes gene_type:complete
VIKIKFGEYLTSHRNETTYRPFGMAKHTFRDVGIEMDTKSDDYDYLFVAQSSISDKSLPLKESVERGLEFVSKITGDYMILDGQDSTSLMGTIDVFRESNALLFLKNSYLKDFDLYKKGWANGRMYWGEGDYSVPDIDELKPRMKLTGYNWCHPTLCVNLDKERLMPKWVYDFPEKEYDISCMFGYPTPEPVYEHGLCQTDYYDLHRKNLFDTLGDKYNVAGLVNGQKIPIQEYYRKMMMSKIVLAPLGYGELAPRDVEATIFECVLMKPDVSHILTEPFIYEDDETYIAVNYDWSNLEEKVDYVLSDWKNIQERIVHNTRKKYEEKYHINNFVLHFYNILKDLGDVTSE